MYRQGWSRKKQEINACLEPLDGFGTTPPHTSAGHTYCRTHRGLLLHPHFSFEYPTSAIFYAYLLCQDLCSGLRMKFWTDIEPTLMESPNSQASVHKSHPRWIFKIRAPRPRVGPQSFQEIGMQATPWETGPEGAPHRQILCVSVSPLNPQPWVHSKHFSMYWMNLQTEPRQNTVGAIIEVP